MACFNETVTGQTGISCLGFSILDVDLGTEHPPLRGGGNKQILTAGARFRSTGVLELW